MQPGEGNISEWSDKVDIQFHGHWTCIDMWAVSLSIHRSAIFLKIDRREEINNCLYQAGIA